MLHASVRTLGPITGGVNTLIEALLDCVGETGTLLAYVDFEPFYESDDPESPVFDKRIAHASRDHGILHEALRTWPGAIRSDHPDAGVVAIGRQADWLTTDHPMQYGYGVGSPFDKFVGCNGRVLLLGAPLDTITVLHYAEHLADIPDKRIRRYRRLMPSISGPVWIEFEEFDTSIGAHAAFPDNCFEVIATEYLQNGGGVMGAVGMATSYLFDARALVHFGVGWMERRVLNNEADSNRVVG